MKDFYQKYFDAKVGRLYHNPDKNFYSYFLSFENGCRLELMHKPDIQTQNDKVIQPTLGLIHFAVSVGSEAKVNQLTEQIRLDGYQIIGAPRTTGDGYYESVILDPEKNIIEITV